MEIKSLLIFLKAAVNQAFCWSVLVVVLLLVVFSTPVMAQDKEVSGTVRDASNNDPIPFANVFFKNTSKGTITDTSGRFIIKISEPQDSLTISVLGFKTQTVSIRNLGKKDLEITLTSDMYDLQELVINPGENPAWEILRRAIAARDQNSPASLKSYQYDEYSKIEFDLNHFTEKIRNNILLRPFDFIWDHVDSTDDGVAYLPVLLIENLSTHYYSSEGNHRKEVVHATQTTGLEGPKIMEFVQDMYILPNFYENYVDILDKQFPSPLNDNYKSNYRFYLTDSLTKNGETFYQIIFKPRTFNGLAFNGQMLIHKGSYALAEITVRFDITANVNFVRSYWIKQSFEINEGHWVMSSSKLLGDFTVLENQSDMTGFFGKKTTEIRNMRVDPTLNDSIFKGIDEKVFEDSARDRDEVYWQANRGNMLTRQEQDLYTMVERIKEHPAFILRKNIIEAIWTGYYPKKYIDLGDIYTFYSYNQVEYSRFKLAFRSNESLWNNSILSGFGAYGDRDNRFKYGGWIDQSFGGDQNHFFRFGGGYRFDIEQLGWSYNFIPIDHLFASLIQLNLSGTRTYNERIEGYVERQWFTGLATRLTVFQHTVSPNNQMIFLANENNTIVNVPQFRRGGLKASLTIAPRQAETYALYASPTHRLDFYKMPVVSMEYSYGQKDMLGSQFDFQEIRIRLDHRLRFRKWGYTNYLAEAGKILGTMPYHFLHIPYANEILFYDRIAYNLMNYLEFVNDEFVQLQVEHHFEGLLFNLIPWNKKLKLRSLVFGKAMAGRISNANFNNQYLFAAGSTKMTNPYYEVGFGIENILKISRIDFVWRMNYLDHPGVYPFIIKPSFQFKF